VEQPARAATKKIRAKDIDVDFLIIVSSYCFLRPDLFPSPHCAVEERGGGVCAHFLATRELHDARLFLSATERKYAANIFSDS
jgi:hypothetical protein